MERTESTSFGELLRQHRQRLGMTQEELAERAELSVRQLAYLEGGKHTPRPGTVRRLADALALSDEDRVRLLAASQTADEATGTEQEWHIGSLPAAEVHAFLITDLRGYTAFTEDRGNEAGARLAAQFASTVQDVVVARGGQVIELRGDEALAVFSSAHEAVQAALQLQTRLRGGSVGGRSLPLEFGIGLDAGDVVPFAGGYRGGALNRAARLCSLARSGEIFASESMVALVGKIEGAVYLDRGAAALKGFAEPVRVIQVALEGTIPADLPRFSVHEAPPDVHAFLIADLRGFYAFTRQRGNEAAAHLFERFAEIVREAVTSCGGTVIELRGDEALAVFDSAQQAVQAALQVRWRAGQERVLDPTLPLELRIGLDADDAADGYSGGAPGRAAKLCGLAQPGEIVASETILRLAGRVEGLVSPGRAAAKRREGARPIRSLQGISEAAVPPDGERLGDLASQRSMLRLQPTRFIGRQQEIREVSDVLLREDVRLLTLTGPGGAGKTRLAIEVAEGLHDLFPDGIVFVPLAPVAYSVLVGSAIAAALGVKEAPGRPLVDVLQGHLREKQLLLLLDNFEHVVAAATLVGELLAVPIASKILVTSRTVLHLAAEHVYAVPPLALPDPAYLPAPENLIQYDAVALFVERARAAKAAFSLTNENAPAVVEICRRLDGLPLAIELAAARIRLFSPAALAKVLEDRLPFLTGGARDAPSRQHSLRAAIDWSYSLLGDSEQALFARLSVFAGGCTLEAAEEVCNAEGDLERGVLVGIAALVDSSLLQQSDDSADEPRFAMLETIKEYGAGKLEIRGDAATVHSAHAECFLRLAEEAEPELRGIQHRTWLARLDRDLDNLRSAMRWLLDHGRVEEELRLAAALFWFWYHLGLWREGQRWLEEGLSGAQTVAPDVRAKACLSLGNIAAARADNDRAKAVLEEAHTLFQGLGDQRGRARTLIGLGNVAGGQGQYDRATALYEESLHAFAELGDRGGGAGVLFNLGVAAGTQGDVDRAKERLEESLAGYREGGDAEGIAAALQALGFVAFMDGEIGRAESLLEESLQLGRRLGSKQRIAGVLGDLAEIALRQGDPAQARSYLREGLLLAREIGDVYRSLGYLGTTAALALAEGEAERAAYLKGAELAIRERLGVPAVPVGQEQGEEVVARIRASLDEETFAQAWTRGRSTSLERIVADALSATLTGSPDS